MPRQRRKPRRKIKPLHPIDKEILRAMARIRIRATPSRIANTIGIHPTTAQRRIKSLTRKKLTKCQKVGNRTYCKLRRR